MHTMYTKYKVSKVFDVSMNSSCIYLSFYNFVKKEKIRISHLVSVCVFIKKNRVVGYFMFLNIILHQLYFVILLDTMGEIDISEIMCPLSN